jgi:hypothetical protein
VSALLANLPRQLRSARLAREPDMPWSRWVDTCTDLDLTPGQRVIGRVAYDGIDPADLQGSERELAAHLFGPVERVPPEADNCCTMMFRLTIPKPSGCRRSR